MRPIDADKVSAWLENEQRLCNSRMIWEVLEFAKNFITHHCATLDLAQLVPQGEWKLNENHKWACTNCDGLAVEHPDEPDKWQALTACCPNCGARMRKEETK